MSEADYETTTEYETAEAAEYDAELADIGDIVDTFDVEGDPQAVTDAALEQVERTVSDFQHVTDTWRPSPEEWNEVVGTLNQDPQFHAFMAERQAGIEAQQSVNRANAEVEAWLNQHPADQRPYLLQLADEAVAKAGKQFGSSPELARSAMQWAEQAQAERTQAINDLVSYADQAAKRLGVVGDLNMEQMYKDANREMPRMANEFPGEDIPMLTAMAIVAAVATQAPDKPRQLSDFWGTAASFANDLRDRSLPKRESHVDYRANPTATAANVSTGRIQRRA